MYDNIIRTQKEYDLWIENHLTNDQDFARIQKQAVFRKMADYIRNRDPGYVDNHIENHISDMETQEYFKQN